MLEMGFIACECKKEGAGSAETRYKQFALYNLGCSNYYQPIGGAILNFNEKL